MRASDETVRQLLIDSKKVSKDKLATLEKMVTEEKKPLQFVAVRENAIDEASLTKAYAKVIDVPYIELDPQTTDQKILKKLPEQFARQYNTVLFDYDGKVPQVAMEDPDDIQAIDFIKKQLGNDVAIYMAPRQNILSVLGQYRGNISSEITSVITAADEQAEIDEDVSEEDLAEDSPIAQTVNLLIEYAVKNGASDIHIEPRDDHVSVRYRIDGVLKEANKLPKRVLAALVSRIKILSGLKIDERRAPQDGRFKIDLNGHLYGFRVSTLPIMDGEKVVMRVLDESSEPATLEQLGFWGVSLERINKAILQPHGMILVTGPTGSGKSTTLHSVLNILNDPDVNISTVEDPVEYRLQGVNQTQVNPKAGMTFVNGLRALLRQDPDIMMVGEIRDGETAGLGVQSALTGHLVFSTLHTNNAATCLPRLLDMGIEPFLIASTVRVVIGQRLVRRINKDECEEYTPNDKDIKQIEVGFGIESSDDWKKIFKLVKEVSPDTSLSSLKDIRLWRPKPDLEKGQTGYSGRMGIYEVLDNTSEIEKLIVANATSDEIQKEAIAEGMITMQLDGLMKALAGQTSIEEILRVTRE